VPGHEGRECGNDDAKRRHRSSGDSPRQCLMQLRVNRNDESRRRDQHLHCNTERRHAEQQDDDCGRSGSRFIWDPKDEDAPREPQRKRRNVLGDHCSKAWLQEEKNEENLESVMEDVGAAQQG
jgi:hypothetical protein